jgi:hypothetical protein
VSSTLLLLVLLPAVLVTMVWPFAGLVLTTAHYLHRAESTVNAARRVYHELRPFYLPAVAASHVIAVWLDGRDGMSYFTLAVDLLCWVAFRNSGGDDDRWKRRRKKLADRVSVVGGRLAVVSASGGAR